MFDAWFVFRPKADDEHYSLDLWTDVPRPAEFEAFGLVLGIHLTALQKEIGWERSRRRRRYLAERQRFVELVYKTFRGVVLQERYTGAPRQTESEHVAAVARFLRIDTLEVERALAEAEDMGVGELV